MLSVALAAMSAGGCQQAAKPRPAATTTEAAAPTASPTPAPSKVDCAPAPALSKGPDFAPGAGDFAKLETNFSAAYDRACKQGLMASEPLIPANVPHPGTLTVINAPDANVTSIYRQGEDGTGDMVLEYHFLGSDGSRSMPTVDDLHEAIFCTVHGASEAEQDDSGRCLAD